MWLRTGRGWRGEGAEEIIHSQDPVTARSCWCFPGATGSYIEKKALLPEGDEGAGKRASVCMEHTFQNQAKVPELEWTEEQRREGESTHAALEYHLFH